MRGGALFFVGGVVVSLAHASASRTKYLRRPPNRYGIWRSVFFSRSVAGLLRRWNKLCHSQIQAFRFGIDNRHLNRRTRPRGTEVPAHPGAKSRAQGVPVLT